jgi:hypothetical protein
MVVTFRTHLDYNRLIVKFVSKPSLYVVQPQSIRQDGIVFHDFRIDRLAVCGGDVILFCC